MTQLFIRKAQIVINGSMSFDSDDFHFTFRVVKTKKENPNPATVTIYNLSKETRDKIEKDGETIAIYAGYENNVKLLYSGDISEIQHRKDGTDVTTEIKSSEGFKAYITSYLNKSYPAGTLISTIVSDLNDTLGLGKGQIKDIPSDAKIPVSRVYCGDTKKYLRELCKTYGLEYSIQNNQLQVHKEFGSSQNGGAIISAESGLIGSPEKYKKTKRRKKKTVVAESGIKVKSLLMPELYPGYVFKLKSVFYDLNLVVSDVEHTGSTFSSEYYSEIEGRYLSGSQKQ